MHRSYVLVVLATAIAAWGCATAPKTVKTDPYLIPKKEFRNTIKVIALANTEIVEGMPDPAPIQAKFDSLLAAGLQRLGYSVVQPQEYEAVWAKLAVGMGGFIDPDTGKRDEEKVTQAAFQTVQALKADFQIDAVMFPDIVVVEAPFSAGRAVWDGVDQKIQTAGAMSSVFYGSQGGMVAALSLKLTVRGPDGTPVFVNSGGIEVLDTLEGKTFEPVPRQLLFTDNERIEDAVKAALKPLKR
ncbi:MAG: hypothetical protein JSW50_01395 [Candidatus Latescibacterota bacterium]|nr:MAG: hypothetical protein JSW50_01395 [Candidatus Latescibacterota bacterium]